MEGFCQLELHWHYQELCECERATHFKSAVCELGSPSWCKIGDRRESVLGGAWPGKLDTFVPRFRVRALKATAWMGFLFIQCNQEAGDKYKVSLCSTFLKTQRRVHFNLVDHRNFIKYACMTTACNVAIPSDIFYLLYKECTITKNEPQQVRKLTTNELKYKWVCTK